MIFFSKDAEGSFDKLLYYPYTIGKHLQKAISDVNNIMNVLSSLPIGVPGVMVRRTIPHIGTITYLSTTKSYFIQHISWSSELTRFYYVKNNFITFTSSGNIPSVHPALYIERTESYFRCDNGFKVVSRKYRGKDVFNFKDLDGHIICDMDFTQVKPFDEYKDMTARGYTPNRRCYMVFEDGYKEEVNESRNIRTERIINECVDKCLRKYLNENMLNEGATSLLYHFIEPYHLVSLLRRNSFRTSNAETYFSTSSHKQKYIDGKNQRFISMTRNRNHKEGYPVMMLDGSNHSSFNTIICRVNLDGDALNTYCHFKSNKGKQHHLKVNPMDWAYFDNDKGDVYSFLDNYGVSAHNGKEWMMKSDGWSENPHWHEDGASCQDSPGIMSDIYSHPYSQAEDRLTTDVKYIPNANKYIKCIDIYLRENCKKYCDEADMISEKEFEYIKKIKLYCYKLGIPLFFYNQQQAFTKQYTPKSITFSEVLVTHSKYLKSLG